MAFFITNFHSWFFREIAVITGCGTEKGGQLAYQAALDCLIRQLAEDEVFRIMNLKQKAVTRRKKKIAAATYLYQADCDGEWDTTVSHIYAWQVIGFVVFKEEQLLPKKKRIIFDNKNLS